MHQFVPASSLVRKLSRLGNLSDADVAMVLTWPEQVVRLNAGDPIVQEGEPVRRCALLVEGVACRYKLHADGARQIVSFHFPGDLLDLHHFLFSTADHSVAMTTPGQLAWVPYAHLREAVTTSSALMFALWRDTLVDASVFREWTLNVGQRSARERLAHLVCEVAVRMEVAGQATSEGDIDLPFRQIDLADATGLTPVHVNRTIRTLRDEGAFPAARMPLTRAHRAALERIAAFDPVYLHALGKAA